MNLFKFKSQFFFSEIFLGSTVMAKNIGSKVGKKMAKTGFFLAKINSELLL